jgi:hypothetical protein
MYANQQLLNHLRQSNLEALSIARELGYIVEDGHELYELPTPDFCRVWDTYYERHPDEKQKPKPVTPATTSKKERRYIPWTLERKQRNRARLLMSRLAKKISIPILYMDALQGEILKNPWSYGCCPLPDSGKSFPANLPNLRQLAAIEKENKLRGY